MFSLIVPCLWKKSQGWNYVEGSPKGREGGQAPLVPPLLVAVAPLCLV